MKTPKKTKKKQRKRMRYNPMDGKKKKVNANKAVFCVQHCVTSHLSACQLVSQIFVLKLQKSYVGKVEQDSLDKITGDGDAATERLRSRTS